MCVRYLRATKILDTCPCYARRSMNDEHSLRGLNYTPATSFVCAGLGSEQNGAGNLLVLSSLMRELRVVRRILLRMLPPVAQRDVCMPTRHRFSPLNAAGVY